MVDRKIIAKVNNILLNYVKDFCKQNNIIATSNISDRVFERTETNIAVNTYVAALRDINSLADKYRYQDWQAVTNTLDDHRVGLISYITIDSGNKTFTQEALNDNGFMLLSLYQWLHSEGLPADWVLADVSYDMPRPHPFSSNSVYSIIIIKGVVNV